MSSRVQGSIFIGVVILITAGLAALYISTLAASTRPVYLATHDVPVGAIVAPADVVLGHISAAGDDFSALTSSPVGRRLSHAIGRGHLFDQSDFSSNQDLVPVPIAIKAGVVGAGQKIDVWVQNGGKLQLLGRAMTLDSARVLLVPATDEASWLEIWASSDPLYAVVSVPGAEVAPPGGLGPQDALQRLSQVAGGH